jgi:hypothetical protein
MIAILIPNLPGIATPRNRGWKFNRSERPPGAAIDTTAQGKLQTKSKQS